MATENESGEPVVASFTVCVGGGMGGELNEIVVAPSVNTGSGAAMFNVTGILISVAEPVITTTAVAV
jgi:hypothetical protein